MLITVSKDTWLHLFVIHLDHVSGFFVCCDGYKKDPELVWNVEECETSTDHQFASFVPLLTRILKWVAFLNCFDASAHESSLVLFRNKLILVLNKYLCQSNIKSTNQCSFCNDAFEETIHFFWECEVTTEFINQVKAFLQELLEFEERDNTWNLVFNTIHRKVQNVYNFLVLVMKQYIYACRCANELPDIYAFKNRVYEIRNIEKYNGIITGNVDKHVAKWYNIAIDRLMSGDPSYGR